MTKKQLKRIALATEAHYILTGADTEAVLSRLSDTDARKFQAEQQKLAESWLKQAGFVERPGSLDEIFTVVLST